MSLSSEWLDWLGLGDFRAAVFAGAPGIVVPEIEHGLAEVIDDIGAVEIDVFNKSAAILAIKNDVFVLARRPAAFDHDSDRIGWADGCVGDVRRNEEGLTLTDEVINDA